MDNSTGLDVMSLIIGMTKGKAEGEKTVILDAGEGYTITDTNDNGHLTITTEAQSS